MITFILSTIISTNPYVYDWQQQQMLKEVRNIRMQQELEESRQRSNDEVRKWDNFLEQQRLRYDTYQMYYSPTKNNIPPCNFNTPVP